MIKAHNSFATRVRIVSLALAPASIGLASPVAAETRAGADISLGGAAASNPYQEASSNNRVSATAEVMPWVRWLDEQSSVELRGDLLVNQYSTRPHTDLNSGVTLAAGSRISPLVSLSANASYRSSETGLHTALLNRTNAADELPPITAQLPDVAFGGTRSRTKAFNANVGADFAISPRDRFGLSLGASQTDSSLATARKYNFFSAGLNYSHSLSDRTSLTASVVLGRPQYLGTREGDGRIVTPQVGMEQRLSRDFTLSASIGAAFVRTKLANGTTSSFTSLSGNASLCHTRDKTSFCLNAARQAQPTVIGTVSTTSSVALSYDDRLSSRDTISVTGTWNRNNNASFAISGGPATFYGVSTTVRREFSRRLSVFVSPSYSKFTNAVRSGENVQISAGLRFSFGAIS